jgi:hypothetical protein
MVNDVLKTEVGDIRAGRDHWVHFQSIIGTGSDTDKAGDDQVVVAGVEVVGRAREANDWARLVWFVVFFQVELSVVGVNPSVGAQLSQVVRFGYGVLGVRVQKVGHSQAIVTSQ